MLRYLFPRLTPAQERGAALFAAASTEARRPHWFVEGAVPDTIDGRFAMLTTIIALISVRLERGGEDARVASVALTERFVEAMDAEHRQLGLGDPGLGKTVRKLVGALAGRIAVWRDSVDQPDEWTAATERSVYRGAPAGPDATAHVARSLGEFWAAIGRADDPALAEGAFE